MGNGDSIQERLDRGETIEYAYWTPFDAVLCLIPISVSLIIASLVLATGFHRQARAFLEPVETTASVTVILLIGIAGTALLDRRKRGFRKIRIKQDEVQHLKNGDVQLAILWSESASLSRNGASWCIESYDGHRLEIPKTFHGFMRSLRTPPDLIDYLADRCGVLSKFRTDAQDFYQRGRIDGWMFANYWLGTAGLILLRFGLGSRTNSRLFILIDDALSLFFGVLMILGAVYIHCALNQKRVRLLAPPRWIPGDDESALIAEVDAHEYRKSRGRDLAPVQLEEGHKYVYRRGAAFMNANERFKYVWTKILQCVAILSATLFLGPPLLITEDWFLFFVGVAILVIGLSLTVRTAISAKHGRKQPTDADTFFWIEGEQLFASSDGKVERYPLQKVDSNRHTAQHFYPFGQWEEYGEPGHSVKIDRRYLRPLHPSEDLIPLENPEQNEEEQDILQEEG